MSVQSRLTAAAFVLLCVVLAPVGSAAAQTGRQAADSTAEAADSGASGTQSVGEPARAGSAQGVRAGLEAARERLAGEVAAAREGRRLSEDLAAARNRLAEAAQEVARLSAEASAPFTRDMERRITAVRARPALGLVIENAEGGVRVTGVTPGGAAGEAGVQAGDLIVGIDGVSLAARGGRAPADRLFETLAEKEFGEPVALEISRDGELSRVSVQTREAEVTVFSGFADRFAGQVLPARPRIELPNFGVLRPFGRWQELELVSLTPDLGAYFGTESGLLVVRAPEDDELGLRDGDVILAIGERTPASPEHAMRILASFESGETLRLSILRHQEAETLEVELPEPRVMRRR